MIDRAQLRRIANAGGDLDAVIVSRRYLKQVAAELDDVRAASRQAQILSAVDQVVGNPGIAA